MDQPDEERSDQDDKITLTREMREDHELPKYVESARQPKPSRLSGIALVIGLAGLACGLAGLGAAAWIYNEGQAETRRLASDIAQLRVSLDLYARNAGTATQADSPDLTDLSNRIAVLEQNWRTSSVPTPQAIAPAPSTASNEDCLPSGMRILVAEGDSYPICGEASAKVDVGQVANGYVMLLDGTTIASGGSTFLPGTQCTIGVTSSGDEGLTGYAEIRVTC